MSPMFFVEQNQLNEVVFEKFVLKNELKVVYLSLLMYDRSLCHAVINYTKKRTIEGATQKIIAYLEVQT